MNDKERAAFEAMKLFGKTEERFISEAASTKAACSDGGRERSTMKGKKFLTGLAAAAVITALVCSAAALTVGGLASMRERYNELETELNVPDELPRADIEKNGVEITSPAADEYAKNSDDFTEEEHEPVPVNENEFGPGDVRLTSVVATNHSFNFTMELNTDGLGIPEEMPEGNEDGSYYIDAFLYRLGDGGEKKVVAIFDCKNMARDGNIMTFAANSTGLAEATSGGCVITFGDIWFIKYTENEDGEFSKDREVVANIGREIEFNADEFPPMESRYSTENATIREIDFSVELCPSSLILTAAENHELDELMDIFNTSRLELTLKDGTVLSDMRADFTPGKQRLISGGAVGENRIRFDFATLVDVDEIESVRVDGVEIALG